MLTVNVSSEAHNQKTTRESKLLIKGSKTLKPVLKSLYCYISSSLSFNATHDDPATRAAKCCLNIKLNTANLSSSLFQELSDRLSFTLPVTSTDRDVEQTVLHVDARDSVEELLLLLRCCVLMVRLHPHDLILMEKLQDAVAVHGLLPFREAFAKIQKRCIRFTEAISSQSMCSVTTSFSTDLNVKSSDSYLRLLKQMLEVFLDEMSADRLLRESIAMFGTHFSEGKQSEFSSIHIETVLNAIASHFLLSIYGEHSLAIFTRSLVWTRKEMLYATELSLTAAISLVKHPVMSSSILLHAHLISLVSEVIGISLPEVGPNARFKEIYLSAFHDSVILYCGHLSKLLPDSSSNPSKQQRTFWKHFKQPNGHSEVYDKVNVVLAYWESSWRAHIGNMFTKTNSNLATDATTYIKMNINMFHESSRGDMFSFLNSLVKVISAEVNEVLLHRIKEMSIQDYCLLASILKLMSCSLLQAVCCLEKSSLKSSSKKEDAFPGWQSLVGIMSCFRQYNFYLPINVRRFVVDALKSHLAPYEGANMIFLHFAGLLSLCTATGLDFLVRGCLFMMMMVMDVLSFENIKELLRSSVDSGPESQTYAIPPTDGRSFATSDEGLPSLVSLMLPAGSKLGRVIYSATPEHRSARPLREVEQEEGSHVPSPYEQQAAPSKFQSEYMCKRGTTSSQRGGWYNRRKPSGENALRIAECRAPQISSQRVASELQRTRQLSSGGRATRTTNGAAFLTIFIKDRAIIDNLADFIECKEGKDYTAYLNNRAISRYKKNIKRARRRWEKKKEVFNSLGGVSCLKSFKKVQRDQN